MRRNMSMAREMGLLRIPDQAIVDIELSQPFGPYYTYFNDVYVLPGESFLLDLYPSTYDVTLSWSDFYVETYRVEVFDGITTTIFAAR